ncbi:hypothetical protein XELAEV_18034070mg [Xenopus laevis]|uniref:Fucolectin tachylectin-4 pentraxin-1 domain-containing protein n=1 Tax=Xenopus laevis TaxID=8355 RepID=A0A974HEK3_XENLA|nr:hypothetical protein XELAEV_18034070mg [Xenopus laevis]
MTCIRLLLTFALMGWVQTISCLQDWKQTYSIGNEQRSKFRSRHGTGISMDDNKEINIFAHPCTNRSNGNSSWCHLDLNKRFKVESLTILNRGDCCLECLIGTKIHVGDSADSSNPVCGNITDVSQTTVTLPCKGMVGRYVSVSIPEQLEYTQLCEIDVSGEEVKNQNEINLARRGEVKQSSNFLPKTIANKAVDGIKETNYHERLCTHTKQDNPAWWQLDLKKGYKIEKVVIVNRMDCCSERLRGAEIRIGKYPQNNNPVCGTITDISQATINLFCGGMEGRYVSVVIPGRAEYLTLCEVEVYGEESPRQEVLEVNLARSGEAKQSSDYNHAFVLTAGRAIDGIKLTDLHEGPCTHTNQDYQPWWQLDLKKRYKVKSVIIVNRGDCCSERLKGAEIRVGDSSENNNHVCGTIKDVSQTTNILFCNGMEGRYVSVVIPGRKEYLTLCELEVYGEESTAQEVLEVNLARSGEAKQSSDYNHAFALTAGRAIDGIKLTDLHQGPCTHTNQDYQPWWQLDLKKRYKVKSVIIVNRGDCCSERLKGAEIRVGDSSENNNPVCSTITDVSQATITLFCKRMEGRYLSVVIPGRKEYLTLCEVEVYGEESQNQEVVEMNWARSGEVQQSSNFMNGPQFIADRAVDGIKVTDLHKSPCSHTNKDNPAWWRLDLKKRYNVQSVVIVNRMDGHSDRLRGATIRVGNFAVDDNPVCGTIHDVSEATITLPCNGMEGRYVSVVIPGRAEYLTLCEVEVYGEESTTEDANNLARSEGVSVNQSSVYPLVPPPNAQTAVDGNKETNYARHPCAHTKEDFAPWWQLDLKKRHKIETVVIVNRMDCCHKRLLGAEIRVGDSAHNNNPVCGTITDVSQATITQFCNGMDGRYVSVVIPGRSEFLQLCEVEVYGEESIHQEVLLESSGESSGALTESAF